LGRTRSRKPHNNNSKLNNKNSCRTWRKTNNKKFRKQNNNNKSKTNNKNSFWTWWKMNNKHRSCKKNNKNS
jgi:hypothetical protein